MRTLQLFLLAIFMAVGCKDKPAQSILEGEITLLCDESLVPIIEDQIAVFESDYRARINLKSLTEAEIVKTLLDQPGQVAILSRDLSDAEVSHLTQKKIVPRRTIFAKDAVAFVRKKSSDTLIRLDDIIAFAKGNKVDGIEGLVFDNLNSGTYRVIAELAGFTEVPSNGFFSFTTNREAMEYVAQNSGVVGVIGYNWLTQPSEDMQPVVKELSILGVKGEGGEYYLPTQENLGMGKYPLARNLFLIDCQGKEGPAMGFASFIAGERGQRIILQSGLMPIRMPSRSIVTRKSIE